MAEWGACGVGQSSWGPAVYGIVDGEDGSQPGRARPRLARPGGHVYEGPFRSDGARVWRAQIPGELKTADWLRLPAMECPQQLVS